MVRLLKNNWILIVILFLAIFLRVARLDYVELFGDEVDAGYQAYSLLTTGADYKGHLMPAYVQSFSEWRAPGLMYAMVPFIKLFGLNEWGVRLTSASFGILSIIVFYFLMTELGFSKKVGLATSFLLAVTPWQIQYSRAGFEITLMSTLVLAGGLALIRGVKTKSNLGILIAGGLFSGAIYTYNTANLLVPLLSVLILIVFKATKKQILFLVVTGMVLCLPMGWQIMFGHGGDRFATLTIFNNKNVTAEIINYRNGDNNGILSKVFYNKATMSLKRVFFNYSNAFGANFLFNEGDVTFRQSLHQVGNLFWIELPLIGLLMIAPIPSSLTIDGYNHATRLFLLVYPLSALAAIGFANLKVNFKVLVVLGLLLEVGFFQYYYWTFYRDESWRWWQTGYKEAMSYVGDHKNEYQMTKIDNTYEPALIRYLFWNRTNPRTIFGLKDKGDFCLDKICFVDFGDKFKIEEVKSNTLYLLSQERNVGGDRDLSKSPPKEVKVLKTIRNYYGEPIFYLVTGEKNF